MSMERKAQRANGTATKKTAKTKPGTKRKKKALTADEQLLRAWRKTYENRHTA
jgi:hypothetical protein